MTHSNEPVSPVTPVSGTLSEASLSGSRASVAAESVSAESPRPLLSAGGSLVLAVVALIAVGFSAYTLGRQAESSVGTIGGFDADLPALMANAAVTSESYSVATGSIGDEADGLFVLDHNSGLLQCSVIYPRMGRFMGQFTINVGDALGAGGKGGSYLLITGRADFPRSSNNPVASTVVYVMDTATGNYASYFVPFNRQAMTANRPQQDTLRLIATGTANPVIDRDSLR